MHPTARRPWLMIGLLAFTALASAGQAFAGAATQPTTWIRPDGSANAKPIWGIAGGIAVGLWPADGPRGLIRIYTPYLDQQPGRIMNFIAVEPIVNGERNLSEIEHSAADNAMGKRMISLDHFDAAHVPTAAAAPARGVVARDGDKDVAVETLRLYVAVEKLDNGARPVVEITLRSDRPHEITLRTFAAADSAPMQSCVLTATMGNYARLRHLQLKDRTIDALPLFAGEPQEGWGFFPWHEWPIDQMTRAGDDVTVSATGELDAAAPPKDWHGWPYEGKPAVQTWTTPARPGVQVRVNGRTTFWATKTEIPGGAAFENFELKKPYEAGDVFRFSIEPAGK